MTNTPENIVSLINRLDVNATREALDAVVYRYTRDQIDMMNKVRDFVDTVELIQRKTIKQVPALFLKGERYS